MATTLTRQTRPNLTSVRTIDGEAMHAQLAHDMVYGLNNLTKCSPYFGTCVSPGKWVGQGGGYPGPSLVEHNSATSGESFLAQVPAILPRDATRFCWTMGFRHNVTAAEFGAVTYAHPVSIDEITVYISPNPYTGKVVTGAWSATYVGDGTGLEASDNFFDVTRIGPNYGMSRYSTPIACAASVEEYHFVDMATGGGTSPISAWMPFTNPTNLRSVLNNVWLTLTFNRHSTDSAALNAPGIGTADGEKMKVCDFSWWVDYE